jgi:hypothetical protein
VNTYPFDELTKLFLSHQSLEMVYMALSIIYEECMRDTILDTLESATYTANPAAVAFQQASATRKVC